MHTISGLIELVLSVECKLLATVGNFFNEILGRLFQVNKDLISKSIEPLYVERFYNEGNDVESFLGIGFGLRFPFWASTTLEGAGHHYALSSEREGFVHPWCMKKGNDFHRLYKIDSRVIERGYTNVNRTAFSRNANLVNWKAFYRSKFSPSEGFWHMHLGDRSRSIYGTEVTLSIEQKQ